MRVNLFSLKDSYAFHLMALMGNINIIFSVYFYIFNYKVITNSGIICFIIVFYLNLSFIILFLTCFLIENFFHIKVKNNFLKNNKFYDICFDTGIIFYFLFVLYFIITKDVANHFEIVIKTALLLFFFILFILLRLLKFLFHKNGKKNEN